MFSIHIFWIWEHAVESSRSTVLTVCETWSEPVWRRRCFTSSSTKWFQSPFFFYDANAAKLEPDDHGKQSEMLWSDVSMTTILLSQECWKSIHENGLNEINQSNFSMFDEGPPTFIEASDQPV